VSGAHLQLALEPTLQDCSSGESLAAIHGTYFRMHRIHSVDRVTETFISFSSFLSKMYIFQMLYYHTSFEMFFPNVVTFASSQTGLY